MGGNRRNLGSSLWGPVFRRPIPKYLGKPIQIGSLGGCDPPHDGLYLPSIFDVGIVSGEELVQSLVLVQVRMRKIVADSVDSGNGTGKVCASGIPAEQVVMAC